MVAIVTSGTIAIATAVAITVDAARRRACG